MKVIFNHCGTLAVTSKENYERPIWDANKITLARDFDSPQEIIDYYCKWFHCKETDFEIHI
jgi:hypothetical protein